MPRKLKRHYEHRHLHFITFSCYRRRALLTSSRRKDAFLRILEQTRRKYHFAVLGYVVMPEHVHLLLSRPEVKDLSVVMQALKLSSSRRFLPRRRTAALQSELFGEVGERHFWQKRFYDFNVFTERKLGEKLRYIHRNPVKRGLVSDPAEWMWSSYRYYMFDEPGLVTVTRFQDLGFV